MEKNLLHKASYGLYSYVQKHLKILKNHQHAILKGLSLVVLMLFIPIEISAQCQPDIAGLEADLPDMVDVTVTAKPGSGSYFTITVEGTSSISGTGIQAWCADQDLSLENPESDTFDVYSTYEQGLLDYTTNVEPDVGPIGDPPYPLIEKPENLDALNWLVNYDLLGDYTFGQIQYAIWLLLDDSVCEECTYLSDPTGQWNSDPNNITQAQALADLALDPLNEGFTPGCGDLIAIALVSNTKQTLIITKEVPPLPCQDDTDGDGVNDCDDICEGHPDDVDTDGDGVPDGCDICEGHPDDVDTDGDGVPDGCDICEGHPDDVDTDGDGVPDGCDICEGHPDDVDTDGDGVPDGCDICEGHPDDVDTDGDGVPDGCDICEGHDDSVDTDGDGVPDGCDICEGHDDSVDTDGDGVPDGCDICEGHDDSVDTDGDGVPDGCDICEGHDDSVDTDGDGVPDGCDICEGHPDDVDTDGDGVPDGCDICEGYDDAVDTDGDGVPDGCDDDEVDCGTCDGKVTELKLQYNGTDAADIVVKTKKKGETSDTKVVFEGNVAAGGMFSFVGNDKKGTLGTEITIYVNGEEHTKIHTSCSQPIGPGLISGDFEVISGSSRNGGELCPVDTPPDDNDDDCECEGKVTELELQYNGADAADIRVETKKKGETSDTKVVFDDNVAAGGMFSFVGNDKKGTLGTEITIYVNGEEHTKIHTSCSQPIGPGLISGDFEVISGTSRNGGELCPVDTPPDDNDDDCECEGKVTELELQYNGADAADIRVETKKKGETSDTKVVFDDNVAAGGMFSFVGNDKKGTLGTEITIYVNGEEHTKIHTSCSQPIGPGLISGDFEVISGSSRNGGELCPIDSGTSYRTAVRVDYQPAEISEFSVKAWPNPSDNHFSVKVLSPNLTDKVTIEVFDMRSRLIHKNQFNSNTDYNFGDNFNAGLYFVRIHQTESIKTIKVMKR